VEESRSRILMPEETHKIVRSAKGQFVKGCIANPKGNPDYWRWCKNRTEENKRRFLASATVDRQTSLLNATWDEALKHPGPDRKMLLDTLYPVPKTAPDIQVNNTVQIANTTALITDTSFEDRAKLIEEIIAKRIAK
jgi:hypothetical protein